MKTTNQSAGNAITSHGTEPAFAGAFLEISTMPVILTALQFCAGLTALACFAGALLVGAELVRWLARGLEV